MRNDWAEIYESLWAWCEQREFAGYDPFDGLNSRLFQATPLKNFTLARLAFLQTVKRSPVNLRSVLQIAAGTNAKGVALFALAELARFRRTEASEHERRARLLLDKLLTLRLRSFAPQLNSRRTAFGYNFDWQSRAFFAPRKTPTVVPTAFAARAFIEAFELFKDEIYIATAREICEFIVHDLRRSFESEDEVCFSYTPLDRSVIFNASLLAGETLAAVGALDHNAEYLKLAAKSARFVVRRQNEAGAWNYGARRRHKWIDNFHTAFILLSLWRIGSQIPNFYGEIETVVKRGFNFWVDNFFLPAGAPKYYDAQIYPIDIHSAAAAIVALCEFKNFDVKALLLAEKVAAWTIENMRAEAGYFYYQKNRFYTVKTPMIRWSQAWMSYALARLLESK